MHHTVDLLLKGDPAVLENYRRAVGHWTEIWARPEVNDIYTFATLLSDEVAWFGRNCGGEDLGHEIMVISGFGMLRSPENGLEDSQHLYKLLDDAFQMGAVPARMRVLARQVAVSYLPHGELATRA